MKTRITPRAIILLGVLMSLSVTLITACERETKEVEVTRAVTKKETVVETVIETVIEGTGATAWPEPTVEPVAVAGESIGQEHLVSGSVPDFQPQGSQRLIIKNANLYLEVADTEHAIDGVVQITGDLQGYIISQRVWHVGEAKHATITVAVPVQEFENALHRLRGLATRVLDEGASGEDVTDQYVDLQSRLRNLEATRDRIRSFLDQAKTVREALDVNWQLSDIEGQIEQVKGRLNYLRDRAAFSVITVNLNMVLTTPPTPDAWWLGETVQEATDALTGLTQGLVKLLVWVTIVLGPFVLALALLLWIVMRMRRLLSRKSASIVASAVRTHLDE